MDAAAFMDDANWTRLIPDMRSGGPKCTLPAHEDCTPLDVASVASALEPGGALADRPGYEMRPGQLDVLRAVVRAFNERRHLMVEAGTGVGKSLAYLVPAVRWAALNDTPVLISTATRNLQGQLVSSDIPLAVRSLPPGADVRVALLKGRGNYLCLRALGEAMQGGYWDLDETERAEFDELVRWLPTTEDGDLDGVEAPTLRPRLACAGDECGGRRCPHWGKCFVQKARDRASRAHVVVANHALVLAEAANPGSGILPPYGRLVFDEAHGLEDAATDFFSYEFSPDAIARIFGRVERRKGKRSRGVLQTVDRALRHGPLGHAPCAETVRERVQRARIAAAFAHVAAKDLLDSLKALFAPAPSAARVRYRMRPGGEDGESPRRQHSLHGLFADYAPSEWSESALDGRLVELEDKMARLANELAALREAVDGASEDGELPLFADLGVQLAGVVEALRQFLVDVKFVLSGGDADYVFWAERGPRGAPCLKAAPLSVADRMNACFYEAKDSVVLCSATLRARDRFAYSARKLGTDLNDRFTALLAASPFDYFRQCCAQVAAFLPDPAAEAVRYAEAFAAFLVRLCEGTRGRALVLFTAYDMMRAVEERVRVPFAERGIELLVQGNGISREGMTGRLREARSPVVLFGAQSFWEGVDVPGDALSCVVLARLPFPQAGEPIVEARGERLEAEGGSSFRDYVLPEALIAFRQGFGRLIRAKTDRGVVVVADSRVASKSYGVLFRKSVPATFHVAQDEDELLARVAAFLHPA